MPRPYRRRRRRRYNRGGGILSKASKALSVAYAVKRLVNVEYKHADISPQTSTPSSTPITPGMLNGIAQGDGVSARDGNSIKMTSLYLRYYASINASATNTQLRFVIVKDNQQVSDTSPSWSDVFTSTSTVSHLNVNTLGRFSILRDVVLDLNDVSNPNCSGEIYLKLNDHCRYNGTASTDMQKNGIYIMMVSSESTNTPSLLWTSRVNYIDN